MTSKITIHCAAREYYTGQDTYILPFDLGLDHIDSVQPDGYGEALIFLNDEGEKVINAQGLDFDGESYYKHLTWRLVGTEVPEPVWTQRG